MKLINIVLLISQSVAQTNVNNAEQLFNKLNHPTTQNFPAKMLRLFFPVDNAIKRMVSNCLVEITDNLTKFKGAIRVERRYIGNFAKKNDQLKRLLDSCPKAAINTIIETVDLEDFGKFDQENPSIAINQVTNWYKQLLDAMTKSECKNKTRYQYMVSVGSHLEYPKI